MRKLLNCIISAVAFIYTIWFMLYGALTTIEGALSKSGIIHPVQFAIWGITVYCALYINIFFLYSGRMKKLLIPLSAISALGMLLTISCRFGYEFGLEYYLHCAGSLAFSVITSIIVFTYYLINFKKHRNYSALTIIIGLLLITDLACLIIFKQNALIEAIPILTALIIMPLTLLFEKEKNYASQRT